MINQCFATVIVTTIIIVYAIFCLISSELIIFLSLILKNILNFIYILK